MGECPSDSPHSRRQLSAEIVAEPLGLALRKKLHRGDISVGQCGVALMRQPETLLCTIYERGRVVGFVLDRGVAGFESFDADERSLGLFGDGVRKAPELQNSTRGQRAR